MFRRHFSTLSTSLKAQLVIVPLPCQENDPTLMGRVKKNDAREMQSFYQQYYKKYIQALQNAADKADR